VLHETKDKKVTFCELVEHPGGRNGGEFPQYHHYGVADDGSVYYSTDFPECPTDCFCDEESEDYTDVNTKKQAAKVLRKQLASLEQDATNLRNVLKSFETDTEFVTYFGDDS
jgi:hypothetical protein